MRELAERNLETALMMADRMTKENVEMLIVIGRNRDRPEEVDIWTAGVDRPKLREIFQALLDGMDGAELKRHIVKPIEGPHGEKL